MSVKPRRDGDFFFDAAPFMENRLWLVIMPELSPNRFLRQ
jgi:hypothetical protein